MKKILVTVFILNAIFTWSQNLPAEWRMDAAQHVIKTGGLTENGLYKHDEIKTFDLEFAQTNWWTLLANNYDSGELIEATLTVDGVAYPQVGVGFKGQTSYFFIPNEEKKSFSIKTDEFIAGQNIDGYTNFNLNNCFDDASFMREFLFLRQIREHIPAAKAAYVHLNLNGESWGIYPSVQQLNGDFLKEWWLSNDGSNWRADDPDGGFGGGGPQWGDGTAAINWLGSDETEYQEYYTLKSSTVTDPWANLVETCDVLNNSSDLENELPAVLDIDRTLWFLASEIAWGDDDSYVYKGKMDYYCYWEIETGRLVPQEYDGNSVLIDESEDWTPFYHVSDVNYPLLNVILNVPVWRQRYLAHLRTLLADEMEETEIESLIDFYDALINQEVQDDPKKLYTYTQYNNEIEELKTRIDDRVELLMNNSELNTTGATISDVVAVGQNGEWTCEEGEEILVNATVSSPDGLYGVNLYYSSTIVGNFSVIAMMDDGNNGDGAAGDGVFGAMLPAITVGQLMEFYVQAVENSTAKTQSFSPVGAEHDVYYYTVLPQWDNSTDLVINEVMASNSTTATDEQSEYEDWIELYNNGTSLIDLTGYYITDNAFILDKWDFAEGTMIAPNDYLILWADEDSLQGMLHCNFKLSSNGEMLTLTNAQGEIADQISFTQQQSDMGYARVPNGTGDFVIQGATFSANNNFVGVSELQQSNFTVQVFPNPATDYVNIRTESEMSSDAQIVVRDVNGREVMTSSELLNRGLDIIHLDTSQLETGTYFISVHTENNRVTERFVVIR